MVVTLRYPVMPDGAVIEVDTRHGSISYDVGGVTLTFMRLADDVTGRREVLRKVFVPYANLLGVGSTPLEDVYVQPPGD